MRLALLPAPDAGELVHVPLPAAPSIGLHLGVDRLRFTRTTVAEATTWTVDAAAAFWCSGLPMTWLPLVPSSPASELRGTLQLATGTEASVTFGVSPVLPVATIVLPPLEVGDTHIDLSDAPLRDRDRPGRGALEPVRGGHGRRRAGSSAYRRP